MKSFTQINMLYSELENAGNFSFLSLHTQRNINVSDVIVFYRETKFSDDLYQCRIYLIYLSMYGAVDDALLKKLFELISTDQIILPITIFSFQMPFFQKKYQ